MMPEIRISMARQILDVIDEGQKLSRSFQVSTARKGPGEQSGSGCTPRGMHIIRAKIGGGYPLGTVFSARRPTGEVYSEELAARFPERDWILTRILWLSGIEIGHNRLGNVDTMRRYIYIHGTPDSQPMGVPASHGCIRMRNADIVNLHNRVAVGTRVTLCE